MPIDECVAAALNSQFFQEMKSFSKRLWFNTLFQVNMRGRDKITAVTWAVELFIYAHMLLQSSIIG